MTEPRQPPIGQRHRAGRRAGLAGVALIEVMLTLLLLSVSAAAWWHLTQRLSTAMVITRLGDAANRLAQNRLEDALRYTTSTVEASAPVGPTPPSVPLRAWAQLAPIQEDVPLGTDAPLAHVQLQVSDTALPLLKSVTAGVSWSFAGRPRHLALHTLASGVDPRLPAVAALVRDALDPDDTPSHAPASPTQARASLPRDAIVLDSGLAMLRLWPDDGRVWVLDRLSGMITQSCWVSPSRDPSTLRVAHLEGCSALSGMWLSGSVRFADPQDPTPEVSKPDPGGVALGLDLNIRSEGAPASISSGSCVDNAPDTPSPLPRTHVRFHCRLPTWGTPPTWSGRIDIVPRGWTLGTTASDWRVCRYSADQNGNGRIDNAEHPATYVELDTSLDDQNFLIVRGDRACPGTAQASGEDTTDLTTQPHQP